MAEVYAIEYLLRDKDGKVLDSNLNQRPLEFVSGTQTILPALERVIEQMEVGEERIVELEPEEGFGLRQEELVETLPRSQFEGIELEKGMTLYGQTPDQQVIAVTVVDFDDEKVVIDYNHPLAGKELVFQIRLLGKRPATRQEELTGEVQAPDSHNCGCGSCSC